MPFINVKVNVKVSDEKEEEIKTLLGKAISCIPGKSESWLMVNIEDQQRIYFRGDKNTPNAFIEVKIYGSSSKNNYNALTERITDIVSSVLGISSDRIYIKYEETPNWGWNGSNF